MTQVRWVVVAACLMLGSVAFGVGSGAGGPACVDVDGVEELRLRYADWGGVYITAYLLIDSTYLVSASFETVGLRSGFDLLTAFVSLAGRGNIEGRISMLHLDPCTLRAGYLTPLAGTGLLTRVAWSRDDVVEVLRWVDEYIRQYAYYTARSTLHGDVAADAEPGEDLAQRTEREWRLLQAMRDDPFVSSPRLASSATAFRTYLDDVAAVEALRQYDMPLLGEVLAFREAFDAARLAAPRFSPSLPFLRLQPEPPVAFFIPYGGLLAPLPGDDPLFVPTIPWGLVDRIDQIIGPVTPP